MNKKIIISFVILFIISSILLLLFNIKSYYCVDDLCLSYKIKADKIEFDDNIINKLALGDSTYSFKYELNDNNKIKNIEVINKNRTIEKYYFYYNDNNDIDSIKKINFSYNNQVTFIGFDYQTIDNNNYVVESTYIFDYVNDKSSNEYQKYYTRVYNKDKILNFDKNDINYLILSKYFEVSIKDSSFMNVIPTYNEITASKYPLIIMNSITNGETDYQYADNLVKTIQIYSGDLLVSTTTFSYENNKTSVYYTYPSSTKIRKSKYNYLIGSKNIKLYETESNSKNDIINNVKLNNNLNNIKFKDYFNNFIDKGLIKEVNIKEYDTLSTSPNLNILYVGSDTCKFCALALNQLKILNSLYSVDVNYININKYKNDLSYYTKNFSNKDIVYHTNGVPMIFLVKNGKIINYQLGYIVNNPYDYDILENK